MRVTKTIEGVFVVEDEPMRLAGPEAEQFLAEMDASDASGPNSARVRFLAECDAAYKRTQQQPK